MKKITTCGIDYMFKVKKTLKKAFWIDVLMLG
jgi:hypothetical protein